MAQLKDLLVYGKSRFIDKIYASDQFISKVAQGTSPFLVDSSTWVENLNVDLLDGYHAEDLMAGGRNYIIDLRANPQTFNPDYLKDIVFISESDYSSLISNGTITKNGITHSYSSSNWYITDKIPEIAEHAYSADYASSAAVAESVSITEAVDNQYYYPVITTNTGAPVSLKISNNYLRFYLDRNNAVGLYLGQPISNTYFNDLKAKISSAGGTSIILNDASHGMYIDDNINFFSDSANFYFIDGSFGTASNGNSSWTSTQIYAGEFMGNIEWDNILNKPASATGAYGYIGKTPVQASAAQENLIGIGDSSFTGKMDSSGQVFFTYNTTSNNTPILTLKNSAFSNATQFVFATSSLMSAMGANSVAAHMIGKAASACNQASFGYSHVADGCTNNYATIGLWGHDKLLNVLASGNVGIGTTTPSEKLQVAGTIYSSVAQGTQPFKVDSSTLVPKLNVDLLDNEHASQIRAKPYTGIHEIYSTDPYFLDSSLINSTTTFFGYQANTSIVDSPVPGCPTNKALLYTTYKAINTEYFKVIPGSRVGIECWVMRETGAAGTDRQFSFQVKTYTSTGTVCTSTNVVWRLNITGDSIWKKYSYSQLVPDNATQLNVYFEFNYNNSGKPTYFGGLHIYYQDITAYYLLDTIWGDSSTGRLPTPIVYKHARTYASNATAGWKKIATWTTETLTSERKSKITFFVSGSPKLSALSKADGILSLNVCWAANSTAASTPTVMSAIWDLATSNLADTPDINPDHFVLTWKVNTSGTEESPVYTATMNLYCYRPKDYSSYSFQVIDETSGNGFPANFWTVYNNTGANTTIPAEETQVLSTIATPQAPIIYKHGRGYSANVVNFFWKKVADWTTASIASERACKISFYVSGGYHWGRINGILSANVRWASGSTATSSPAQAELTWDFVNSTIGNHDVPINLDRFVLTWKVNTGGTEESPVYTATMKIYFYLDRGYTSFSFTKIEEHNGYGTPVNNWKLYGVSGGTAANASTNLPEDENKIYSKLSLIQNPTLGDYAKDKGIIQLYSTDPLFDAEIPASYFNAAAMVDTSIAGSPISKVLRYTSNTSFWSPYIYVQRGRDIRFDIWLMRLTTASGTAGVCRLRIHRFDKNKNKIDNNSYFDALAVVPPQTSVWEKYSYVWHINESGAEYPTPDPDADPPVESTYKGDGIGWMRIQVLMNNGGTAGIETFLGGVHAYYDDINHLEARRGINEIYSTDYEFLNYNEGQTFLPTATNGGKITGTVVKTPVGGSPVPKVILFNATQRTSVQAFTPLIPVQPGKTILVEVWLMRLSTAGGTLRNWNFQLYQFGKNRENIAATTYITMRMSSTYMADPSTNLSPTKNSKWTKYTYLYTVPTSSAAYETSGYEGDGVHWIRFHMTANANTASGNTPTYFGGLHVSYTSDTLDSLHAREIKAIPNTGILDVYSTDPIFNDPELIDSSLWGGTIVNNPVSDPAGVFPCPTGKVLYYPAVYQPLIPITDFIPVTPGAHLRIEAWLMRLATATGTNRTFYVALYVYDKNKNKVLGSGSGLNAEYFYPVSGVNPATDGKWHKYTYDYTIPTSGTPWPTPDPDADPPVVATYEGDGAYYVKFGIIANYNNASAKPIYFGGIHAYYTDILQQDPVFRETLVSYAPAYSASASWTYPGGSYASVANPNIRLLGDSSYGLSTIEFISARGDTSINRPTDCAFIQYQPYGTTTQSAIGTQPTLAGTGEVNRLVIGVNNDTNDRLILQTPNGDGLRHAVATNNYMIWDEGNDGSGSGLDADLLDGQHGSYYAVATHNHDSSYLKPSQVTGVASLTLSTSDQTYLTVGSTQYKIKLPATIPWTVSTTDKYVEQSQTTTGNYRGIVLGYKDNASPNTGIADTVTNVVYTTNNLTVQPSTGNIVTKGWVGVGTGGVNSYIGSDAANNIYLHNSSGYALVASGNVVRRGTSFATAQLGDSANPWADVYTKMIHIDSSAAGAATHINFNRTSYNYLNIPTGGKLGVSINGAAAANQVLMVTAAAVTPGEKNGTIDLGSSSYYWKNVYTKGVDVSGNLTIDSSGRIYPTKTTHRIAGNYGYYDSHLLGHIWSMGTAYSISNDGKSPNTLYGLAYFHTNWSNDSSYNDGTKTAKGTYAGGHQFAWFVNGVLKAAIGESAIYTVGQFISKKAQGTAPLVVDSSTMVSKLQSEFAKYAEVLRDPTYHTSSARRNSANFTFADGGLHYYLATSTMTAANGKPAADGHILHMAWDNSKWDAQLTLPTSATGAMQWRVQTNGTDASWTPWKTVLDSSNVGTYAATINHNHDSSYHPLNGKISRAGGSYSWYQFQQYKDASKNSPSYYSADCAIININSYSGWQPWIRGVASDLASWCIGQYTDALHVARIAVTNTTNTTTNRWDFQSNGNFKSANGFVYGNSTYATSAYLLRADGSVTAISSFATSTHNHDSSYVKLSSTEQTIESTISSYSKGVIEFYRSSGDHICFISFANKSGSTKRTLGAIGFYSGGTGKLQYRDVSANYYNILHAGNSEVTGDNSSTITVKINGVSKSLTVASPTSVTGVSSLTLSTSDQTYLTVGSTQYKIKLPATIPWTVSTTDVAVTQTATSSSNTSWRPLLLGQKYSDAATFSISTDTSTAYATHLAKFKPSTGQLAIGGLYKMKTDGTVDTSSNTLLFNTNGSVTETNLFVNGTQTAATGSWKGNLPATCNITALYDGLTIYYRLPVAGSGNASLQLYKSDGTTAVGGNCNVYCYGTTRLTTHYPAQTIIRLTYYNGSWWASPVYNTNSWRGIYAGGTSVAGTGTGTYAANFTAGAGLAVSYAARGTSSDQSGNNNYFNITYTNTGVLSVDTSGNFLRFNHADSSTLLIAPAADKIKTVDASDGAGDDICYLTFTSCTDYPSYNYNTAAQYSNIYTYSGIILHPANGRTSFFGIGDFNSGGAYSFNYGDSSLTNLLGAHTFTFGTGLTIGTHTQYQTIFGKYNVLDSSALFIIADGSSNSSRHNILTLDASGSLILDGLVSQLTVKSVKYVPATGLSYSANSTITFGAETLYPIEFGGSAGTITLSFTWNSPQLGEEKHIIGYCNYTSGKTINIGDVNSDSSNTIKNVGSVSMPAHGYIEISILYVNTNASSPNRYFVRAVGSEAN